MTHISVLVKKSSTPQSAKSKSAKKGDNSSKTYSNIVPFKGDLPPVGNTILESSLPPFTRTHSSRRLLQASICLLLRGYLLMLFLLARPKVAKGRYLLLLHPPLLRGEYVISNFSSFSLFFYRVFFAANRIYLLAHSLLIVFSFLLQSKHKEDTSVTHPILLDEPKFEVCPPLFPFLLFPLLHIFPLPRIINCPISLSHLLSASSIIMHCSPFLFFFFFCFTFFRLNPSLSPYITPWPRKFLSPWAHP